MCLIIHKPAGATIPGDLLRSAWEDNPDGAGIMYPSNDGPRVYKVMPKDWADPAGHIEKVLSELGEREVGVHFRWKTHGPITRDNCHPFPIPGTGGYVMHNGILAPAILGPHYQQVQHVLSDTAFYTMTVLHDAPGTEDTDFWELVGGEIGTSNKLLVMDALGRFHRVNDKQWADYKGLRLSNTLSIPDSTGKGWRQFYNYANYGREDTADYAATGSRTDEAMVVYTTKGGKPQKLTRRERKILNRCLRAGTWEPFKDLHGKG